jgi:hypothetical protein
VTISVSVTGSAGQVSTSIGPGTGGAPDAPSNGTTYGRKDGAWVDITSPANLQVRRGTAAEVAAITPLEGEPVWATDTKQLLVGDGVTQGGKAVGRPFAASAPFIADAILVDSAVYSTPLSVALSGTGSTWRVFGSMQFRVSDVGADQHDLDIDLEGSGGTVVKGTAWIRLPDGTSETYRHFDGELTLSFTDSEFAYMEFDYVVELSASSLNFGFPVRLTDGTSYVTIADGEGSRYSRLFAERLV